MSVPDRLPTMPAMRIETDIKEGRGTFRFTFSPHTLQQLLERAGVTSVWDFDPTGLRVLCIASLPSQMESMYDALEQQQAGSVRLTNTDGAGLGSDELGYELAKRFAPDTSEAEVLLDPTFSPVGIDLRVFDTPVIPGTELTSTSLLHTTIGPLDLA